MVSNKVKERLLKKNWAVKCTTEQELNLVLQACDDAGIKWLSGEKATAWDFDGSYPLYIDFCNAIDGIAGYLTGSYTGNCTDITNWFFNAIKNNDDNGKLTPQNAEQEHYVQILLAKMQGIPVEHYAECFNEWWNADNTTINITKKYRIKPEPAPTPLPISREIWSHLDKRWQYAAMDEDGRIFFYNTKPTREFEDWSASSDMSDCPLNINAYGINWETSLTERPKDV